MYLQFKNQINSNNTPTMNLPTFQTTLTSEMKQLLDDPSPLLAVIAEEQRPVAISLPQSAVSNVIDFQKVLRNLSIDARVFLAHKATASPAILSAVSTSASVDIASEAELDDALNVGYDAKKILATGPKSQHFLTRLCMLPGATIAVDSFSELQRLALVVDNQPVNILLRLSRSMINQPGITKKSRFGLDDAQLKTSMSFLEEHTNITLKGIHFHLDSQSIDERRFAVKTAIDSLLDIQQKGFYDATVLDIGGGYGTTHGISKTSVDEFETAIKSMVLGKYPSFTWQAHSFGIRSEGSRVAGTLSAVNVPAEISGVDRLVSILGVKNEYGVSLAESLSENLIELWIEPGSAICADAGVFAAEIIEINHRDGETMLLVDAHRNQLCFDGIEHAADPVLISRKQTTESLSCDAYITGHLCMESDFMTYRKIHFSHTPEPGDVLVWTHTGAYSSHFSASQAIGHPLSAQYTLTKEGNLVKDTQ